MCAQCIDIFWLLPPANEVWGKVIFLHLSVILFTGGVCSREEGAWSWGRGSAPERVPGGDPPGRFCCGRYASYWNAFLFLHKIDSFDGLFFMKDQLQCVQIWGERIDSNSSVSLSLSHLMQCMSLMFDLTFFTQQAFKTVRAVVMI